MKKMTYFISLIISIFICLEYTSASSLVVVTGNEVRFRSGATTDSKIITNFNSGSELILIDKNGGTGHGCDDNWYKASYNGEVGYICSSFAYVKEIIELTEEEIIDYSEYLKSLGFPDSYIPYLTSLHSKHPSWKFKVFKANISFNSMLDYEYKSSGRSLIEDTGRYYDGYKSTDSWSYNYLTDVFNNNYDGGGKFWFAANKKTIAYYMDPRNFLNEKQIFMFELLSYNSAYHTKDGIQKMLKNTFMETGYADNENKKTYADAFLDAAIKNNVSPYLLVSRVIQEVGAKGSTIVSGTVSGYQGYYNFYNIKAHGNTSTETINNGLSYAKSRGWNTPYKAIVGGADFLDEDYISQGQNTLYLQKWDLFGSLYGNHQYMQNIQAPSTESVKTYNGYNNVKLLDSEIIFSIPVFTSIPDSNKLPNSGNPNNYLSSLSVNGSYLFSSASTKTEFSVNLSKNTSSVDIGVTKVSSKSSVLGTGSVAINDDLQTVSIVVTAQNGDKRTYKINFVRDPSEAIDISEILNDAKIKNDGEYIFGIEVGTNVDTIAKNIVAMENKANVTILSKDNIVKNNSNIASGDIIKIKTDREEKSYTLIIYGDVNGDGKISSTDYMNIKNHIMDVKKLSDKELLFADANKDGKVTSTDYMTIKNHIMDVKKIVQ